MKVIASAIAAALTTATATVSLVAVASVVPPAQETSVFQAPPSIEIAVPSADVEGDAAIVEIEIGGTAPVAGTDDAVADVEDTAAQAEPAATAVAPTVQADAAEVDAAATEPYLPIAHTGEGESADVPIMVPGTINVAGNVTNYVDCLEEPSAPEHGAGLWLGSDSTTDGSWGYFIGHNPGDFTPVMDLQVGDAVTVCDYTGKYRTYYVIDTFIVGTETYWLDIEDRVTGFGESIVVQTCCGDNLHYRVVVCA